MLHYLVLFVKGMAYGVTHIAPGLGGALVLIVMGVYEQFVDAVGNLLVRRERWKEYLAFLVPLGLGMVVGMVGVARAITVVWERYPVATQFFFMGLVVGTIPPVVRLHGDMRPTVGRGVALAASLGAVVFITLLGGGMNAGSAADLSTTGGLVYNFFAAFLSGGASVTPGMDGSYILLLFRVYEPVVAAVGDLVDLRIAWGILATTGVGAVGGILVVSKLIDTAIKRAPSLTYYLVLGLIAGSVYGLWPREAANSDVLVHILAFVVGAGIALLLNRDVENDTEVKTADAV